MEESNYYDDITMESSSFFMTSDASEERITVRIEDAYRRDGKAIASSGFLLDAHMSDDMAFIKRHIWLRTGIPPSL
jgi:hypothetical protein